MSTWATTKNADRWLRNNSGMDPVADKKGNEVFEVREHVPDSLAGEKAEDAGTDYYEDILGSISQRELRIIFRGICGGQRPG